MSDKISKDIRYVNRDFVGIREGLMDFAKVYYPNSYNDFNETSPGMMFIEMVSYVGDQLSFYVDNRMKETLLPFAEERANIIALAQEKGYPIRPVSPAKVTVNVYQQVPAIGAGSDIRPDMRYALVIDAGMQLASDDSPNASFLTDEKIDFRNTNPADISPFELSDVTGEVIWFLLRTTATATAGSVATEQFIFSSPSKYATITINRTDVTEIQSVKDSEGNTWYEVPFIAQDTVYDEVRNEVGYDNLFSPHTDTVPYILKMRKTPRRFIKRMNSNNTTVLAFGSGVGDTVEQIVIPNPNNLPHTAFTRPIDPSHFLFTNTYGQVPYNTTLTVTYTYGGGVTSNVLQGELRKITSMKIQLSEIEIPPGGANLYDDIKRSVLVKNPEPASGGNDEEDLESIRENALAWASAQNRIVTTDDYVMRAYAMPAKFGGIAKAVLRKSPTSSQLDLYALGYDRHGTLVALNGGIKQNLITYLSAYRMLSDTVIVRDGYVINIAVEFKVVAHKNHNKRDVILRCIDTIKREFDVKKWQFNQPIVISDLYLKLATVNGVQNIVEVNVLNRYNIDDGYSGVIYDIAAATSNGMIYPPTDPAIFEIKYLNKDILGSCL